MGAHRQSAVAVLRKIAALLSAAILLTACTSRMEQASTLAARRQMLPEPVDAGPFTLMTFAPRVFTPGAPLSVYIEGDGYAFIRPNQLSDDPTPHEPIALELAIRDSGPNVVYIARPCQYVTGPARRNCHPAYWSVARYANDVVSATGFAVDHYLAASGAKSVTLYGYSGGGAVATLLAVRQPAKVRRLVTIAGVLDTNAWTSLDQSTPLSASLNPADFGETLAEIPQVHFIGDKDDVVPVAVANSFARHLPAGSPASFIVVPDQDHHCCWANRWPALLKQLD